MSLVISFTFNPFEENTFVVYDDTKECVIIDPGCHSASEQKELTDFIETSGLKPVMLLNTHCHIDHVAGNRFVKEKYKIPFAMHPDDLALLMAAPMQGKMFGFMIDDSPEPDVLLQEGNQITFGHTALKVMHTPGHSPGGLVFYCEKDKYVIAGDVLFHLSIGRSDLPGGNHETLIASIQDKLMSLPDHVQVYCGHYQATNIGFERKHNPFLN